MNNSTIPHQIQENPIYHNWRNLSPADFIVKEAITDLGECCSQADIAAITGLSLRQISRSSHTLESYGILTISKIGRGNCYSLIGDEYRTHRVRCSDSIQNTNTDIDNTDQMVLIQNDHSQDLRSLDIDPQQLPENLQGDLDALEIKANLKQCFDSAPKLIKQHTPAQVLMFFDDDGAIAANLAHWRESWQAGRADLSRLKPALIWARIVEGKQPPQATNENDFRSEIAPTSPDFQIHFDQEIEAAPIPPKADEIALDGEKSDLWADVLQLLKCSTSKAVYDRHLAQTDLVIDDDCYTVTTENEYSRQWIERSYKPLIAKKLSSVVGEPVSITVMGVSS